MLSTSRSGSASRQYKVVLVGDAGVGKSFLIQRLKSRFDQWQVSRDYEPTDGGVASHYASSNGCHLYILETSGVLKYQELTKIYLKFLDCVIFTFALNDPQSLKSLENWHQLFLNEFSRNEKDVVKFVVGAKMDAQHGMEIQSQAVEFAKSIGAELGIASAVTGTNVTDFFEKVSERLSQHQPSMRDTVAATQCFLDPTAISCVDDYLLPDGVLMSYPDPLLLYASGDNITSLRVQYRGVSMTTEDKTFVWGCQRNERVPGSSSPSLKEVLVEEELPAANPNLLTMCIKKLEPVTLWQHEWLECSGGLATTVRRQPTEVKLARNVVDIKFCSRDIIGREFERDLYYMLLLTTDSRLKECGSRPSQLDIKDLIPSPKPIPIAGNPQIASYSVSCTHAAVATEDGKAMTWGYGTNGALGIEEHETKHASTVPVPIAVNIDVSQVACGVDFTLMLCRDGTVYSCGNGSLGSLGHGDIENKFIPTKIETLSPYNIKAIGAGDYYACAIMSSGWMYAWGLPGGASDCTKFKTKPEKVRSVDNVCVTSMACGAFHTLILTSRYAPLFTFFSDYVYTWGLGTTGALGHGDKKTLSEPRCLYTLPKKKRVKRVAAGRSHSAFLMDDGAVYTCGSNEFGQLGYFTETQETYKPAEFHLRKTRSGRDRRAKDINCTDNCTMVLTEDKEVLVWGKFSYGQSLPDPFPVYDYDVRLIDVTTCYLWEGTQGRESCDVILGLTGDSRILICGCVGSGQSYQVNPWLEKALAPCSIPGLTQVASVGPMLVAVDEQGRPHYVDMRPWVKGLLGEQHKNGLEDGRLAHALFSAISKLDVGCMSKIEFKSLVLPDGVVQVETTLNRFLFRTEIGDLFSWEPFSGSPLELHKELDDKIIVQIACGLHHVVGLSDAGEVLTCGRGLYGQLGHGDMRRMNTFEKVPLCKMERFSFVSCGIVSTVVQTVTGKVYFWGQLDIPRYERKQYKDRLRYVIESCKDFNPRLPVVSAEDQGPVAYKLDFGQGPQDRQLAVVGKTFQFKICKRGEESNVDVLKSSKSAFHGHVFRVEAKSLHGGENIRVKGTVFSSTNDDSSFTGSLCFLYQNLYEASVTLEGRHVRGSPFKAQVEKGVSLKACKLTLIGCDMESLKSVAFTLRHACAENQDGTGFLKFPDSTVRVELWGSPPEDADQKTANMAALASLTDGGVFVYVWDGAYCDFPRRNLKFWLHWLKVKASFAHVIVLGVNIPAERAHGVDLKPFKAINPNLRKAIFAGSEPDSLVQEMKVVVEERLAAETEPVIWSRLEALERKVREKRDDQMEAMDRRGFIRLANACGIEGEGHYRDAVRHLEKTGLALHVGGDHVFLVFDQHWISRELSELAASCHRGLVKCESLDEQKSCLVELLIRKNLAFHTADGTKLYLIPCLAPLPEDVWVHRENKYLVMRHFVVNKPPHHVFTAFPNMAANLSREHHDVTFGLFACVIHDGAFKSRIEAGPCLIDKRKSEVRLIVQSDDQKICEEIARLTMLALKRYIGGNFPEYIEGAVDYVSCNRCQQHYFELALVEKAAKDGDTEVRCEGCKGKVSPADIMTGYSESRDIPPLDVEEQAHSLVAGIPGTPPFHGNASPRQMMRPIIQLLVDVTNKQEKRLIAEMKQQFQNMAKFFLDLKEYDCPRTICLLPDYRQTKLSLKGDILATLKRHLLLSGQKKFLLYLLCEGNGDGTGVHFLETSKHAGYEINDVNKLLVKCVGHLRSVMQLLIHMFPSAAIAAAAAATAFELSTPTFFPSEESIDTVLGIAGLSVATLKQVKWDKYFKEVDGFLKDFQSTTASVTQPKQLGQNFAKEAGHKVGGSDYKHLNKVLKEFGKKDDFGGLVQEYREGIGAVWVCEHHRRNTDRTENVNIQERHF